MKEFDASIELDPNYLQGYMGAYTALWQAGARERAIGYLQRWIEGHPNDPQALMLLDQSRRELGLPLLQMRTPERPLPVPPVNLP